MKKKYKIIITLCVILVLIFTISGIIVISKRVFKSSEEKNNEENNTVSFEDKTKDLFYNNFLITYLLESDIQTGDGTLTIDGEEGIYYTVTDYLLENIKSLDDINELINANLDEATIIRTNKLMQSDYSNHFAEYDGTLYVKKSISPCAVNEGEIIKRENIKVYQMEDQTFIDYNMGTFTPYEDENKELKASTLWYNCMPNFNYIDIETEDIYDPSNGEEA